MLLVPSMTLHRPIYPLPVALAAESVSRLNRSATEHHFEHNLMATNDEHPQRAEVNRLFHRYRDPLSSHPRYNLYLEALVVDAPSRVRLHAVTGSVSSLASGRPRARNSSKLTSAQSHILYSIVPTHIPSLSSSHAETCPLPSLQPRQLVTQAGAYPHPAPCITCKRSKARSRQPLLNQHPSPPGHRKQWHRAI